MREPARVWHFAEIVGDRDRHHVALPAGFAPVWNDVCRGVWIHFLAWRLGLLWRPHRDDACSWCDRR